MIIKGKIIKYERANINTDEIIPARYLNTSDYDELASHCMEDLDSGFLQKKKEIGFDIMITGANMGCGSSREHAPIAIKYAGIKAVVSPSFARIFFRNSINMGLPIFECKDQDFFTDAAIGHEIEIDADNGVIRNNTLKKQYKVQKMPSFLQELISSGGLVEFGKKLLKTSDLK
ncbi:MAG: LeuD/DmdB family oxidoreductase small subunit [Promethearchaeota archaeon]